MDTAAYGRHDRSVELSAAFVTEHWELTEVSVTPLRIGHFGRGVFTVASREGTFAAKVNDAPPDVHVATKELDVFTYLTDRRYVHVPELVWTRQPAPLVHTGDRSVVLMEHVPEHFDPDAPLSPASWAELAEALVALNRFDDYPHLWGKAFIEEVPEELRAKVRDQPIEVEFLELLDLTFDREAAEAFYGAYADAGGVLDADEAFLAGLLQAMFLMWFFNPEGRWRRIRWAVAHEDELCSMIEQARGR